MGRMQQEPLRAVTAEERKALGLVVRSSSERMDRIRRAQALLLVAQGWTFRVAARWARFRNGTTVAQLVVRFNRRGLAALDIAAGRGRKPTYGQGARSQIVATAQQPPDRRKEGTATWSLVTLERRLRRDGLTRLGASTIRRVLTAAGSSYQRSRTWCPTGTAVRQRKAGVVTVADPQTEEKRGPSNKRTGKPRGQA